MPKKPKTARAVHANRGIEAKYKKAMSRMIDEMLTSYEYWLTAAYRKNPPRVSELAQDGTPSSEIQKTLKTLGKKWQARFDEWVPKLAEAYVTRMYKATDSAFRKSLKDAGWAVEFTMTPVMRDAFNASLAENVGLIKSIPVQFHQKIEGIVMRSYSAGRDLKTMTDDLKALYPITTNRAVLIARDQSNKANSVVMRARQLEIGIERGIWMHSHAGKTPRPSHVAANGKEFKIADGCLIDGEYLHPGEKINCRCTSRPVLPF